MEKISNKKFIQMLKSMPVGKDPKTEKTYNVLSEFEINIEKLENSMEKRIINKWEIGETDVYHNMIHHIETHVNSTRHKFFDLYKGLINCINSGSYSGALIISRTILENVSMLDFLSSKFIKLFKYKNYLGLIKELRNLSVPSWRTETVKDYKRTHIYDALRNFKGGWGKYEKDIFKIYDPISEMTHPSATSFLMYGSHQNLNTDKGSKSQSSFSQNSENIQDLVFPMIGMMLLYAQCLVEEIYPKIQNDLIDPIKNSKEEIEIHFKYNLLEIEEYNKLTESLDIN